MEYFLKEVLFYGFGNSGHKSRFLFVILLCWVFCINVLTEQSLQGNVPLGHPLNEKKNFLSDVLT